MSAPLTTEEIQRHLDASPFISFLGLKVLSVDPAREEVVMRASMRPEFERLEGTGQWHGGPLAAIIDTVGDFALGMSLGHGIPTINFRVDYLRPAIKTDLLVTARVRRNGRSIGVADVDIHDEEGTLLAIGRATYSTQKPK